MTYQICTQCIMDTTDPRIAFDNDGVCSHCHYFENVRRPAWQPTKEGKEKLDRFIEELKVRRAGHQYDCMIGLSGGVDSSYLAYYLKKNYDLRILAVHVDAGWNSEQAVSNVENIVRSLDLDFYTYVVDWEEMKQVQRAFLRSQTVNQDTPQDHAYFAALYEIAKKFNIRDFLVGYNIQTESILPICWQGVPAMDAIHFDYICKSFGGFKSKSFPRLTLFDTHVYYPYIYKINKFPPLNYIPYNKSEAKKLIIEKLNWKDYGVKHGESKFTRFFQSYYLPNKFGYDKRRAHLSSLILAGETSREDALQLIDKAEYDSQLQIHLDMEYVAKKLDIELGEFKQLCQPIDGEIPSYPTSEKILQVGRKIKSLFKI